MKLFNNTGEGSREIAEIIGLISSDVDFGKWEAVLPFGVRDVTAIIGREPVAALARIYEELDMYEEASASLALALKYLRQAVAFFAWLKMIPTLDAQHDATGRSRRLGENEKGLTALQEFKDEENIRHLAYEAVDALIEVMDREEFSFWTDSKKYKLRNGLLIRSKEAFDEYYNIGSHRLFVTLLPIIREVQEAHVAPILGREYLSLLLSGKCCKVAKILREPASRAVALLTMQKAIERLPVEVIPNGVVQIQQSQPVNSRLRAEQSARAAVASALGSDAKRYLETLQDAVLQLNGDSDDAAPYVARPIVHSKGMTF